MTGAARRRAAAPAPANIWQLLRQSRVLQAILVVVLSANFALVGTTEVALPALAHARFGADGYGAVLTCVAVAAMVGALSVGKFGDRFRPVTLVAGSLIVGAAGIAAAPFLGGLPGVAAGLAVFGVATGFDNVVSITMIQRWAPPAMLGRVWGLLTKRCRRGCPRGSTAPAPLTKLLGGLGGLLAVPRLEPGHAATGVRICACPCRTGGTGCRRRRGWCRSSQCCGW